MAVRSLSDRTVMKMRPPAKPQQASLLQLVLANSVAGDLAFSSRNRMLAVILSPTCELQQGWAQCPAIRCKSVLRAENGLVVNRPFDETITFKLAELRGKNLLGSFGNTALQLTVTKTVARLEFTKDKRLPLSCDDT
jgi:hypothetical protein